MLLDIELPDMSGIDVLKHLADETFDRFTAEPPRGDRHYGIWNHRPGGRSGAAGACDFLTKPLNRIICPW
ncbi:MAG: hypothetical protein QM706_15245 [Nitrospira sp.]